MKYSEHDAVWVVPGVGRYLDPWESIHDAELIAANADIAKLFKRERVRVATPIVQWESPALWSSQLQEFIKGREWFNAYVQDLVEPRRNIPPNPLADIFRVGRNVQLPSGGSAYIGTPLLVAQGGSSKGDVALLPQEKQKSEVETAREILAFAQQRPQEFERTVGSMIEAAGVKSDKLLAPMALSESLLSGIKSGSSVAGIIDWITDKLDIGFDKDRQRLRQIQALPNLFQTYGYGGNTISGKALLEVLDEYRASKASGFLNQAAYAGGGLVSGIGETILLAGALKAALAGVSAGLKAASIGGRLGRAANAVVRGIEWMQETKIPKILGGNVETFAVLATAGGIQTAGTLGRSHLLTPTQKVATTVAGGLLTPLGAGTAFGSIYKDSLPVYILKNIAVDAIAGSVGMGGVALASQVGEPTISWESVGKAMVAGAALSAAGGLIMGRVPEAIGLARTMKSRKHRIEYIQSYEQIGEVISDKLPEEGKQVKEAAQRAYSYLLDISRRTGNEEFNIEYLRQQNKLNTLLAKVVGENNLVDEIHDYAVQNAIRQLNKDKKYSTVFRGIVGLPLYSGEVLRGNLTNIGVAVSRNYDSGVAGIIEKIDFKDRLVYAVPSDINDSKSALPARWVGVVTSGGYSAQEIGRITGRDITIIRDNLWKDISQGIESSIPENIQKDLRSSLYRLTVLSEAMRLDIPKTEEINIRFFIGEGEADGEVLGIFWDRTKEAFKKLYNANIDISRVSPDNAAALVSSDVQTAPILEDIFSRVDDVGLWYKFIDKAIAATVHSFTIEDGSRIRVRPDMARMVSEKTGESYEKVIDVLYETSVRLHGMPYRKIDGSIGIYNHPFTEQSDNRLAHVVSLYQYWTDSRKAAEIIQTHPRHLDVLVDGITETHIQQILDQVTNYTISRPALPAGVSKEDIDNFIQGNFNTWIKDIGDTVMENHNINIFTIADEKQYEVYRGVLDSYIDKVIDENTMFSVVSEGTRQTIKDSIKKAILQYTVGNMYSVAPAASIFLSLVFDEIDKWEEGESSTLPFVSLASAAMLIGFRRGAVGRLAKNINLVLSDKVSIVRDGTGNTRVSFKDLPNKPNNEPVSFRVVSLGEAGDIYNNLRLAFENNEDAIILATHVTVPTDAEGGGQTSVVVGSVIDWMVGSYGYSAIGRMRDLETFLEYHGYTFVGEHFIVKNNLLDRVVTGGALHRALSLSASDLSPDVAGVEGYYPAPFSSIGDSLRHRVLHEIITRVSGKSVSEATSVARIFNSSENKQILRIYKEGVREGDDLLIPWLNIEYSGSILTMGSGGIIPIHVTSATEVLVGREQPGERVTIAGEVTQLDKKQFPYDRIVLINLREIDELPFFDLRENDLIVPFMWMGRNMMSIIMDDRVSQAFREFIVKSPRATSFRSPDGRHRIANVQIRVDDVLSPRHGKLVNAYLDRDYINAISKEILDSPVPAVFVSLDSDLYTAGQHTGYDIRQNFHYLPIQWRFRNPKTEVINKLTGDWELIGKGGDNNVLFGINNFEVWYSKSRNKIIVDLGVIDRRNTNVGEWKSYQPLDEVLDNERIEKFDTSLLATPSFQELMNRAIDQWYINSAEDTPRYDKWSYRNDWFVDLQNEYNKYRKAPPSNIPEGYERTKRLYENYMNIVKRVNSLVARSIDAALESRVPDIGQIFWKPTMRYNIPLLSNIHIAEGVFQKELSELYHRHRIHSVAVLVENEYYPFPDDPLPIPSLGSWDREALEKLSRNFSIGPIYTEGVKPDWEGSWQILNYVYYALSGKTLEGSSPDEVILTFKRFPHVLDRVRSFFEMTRIMLTHAIRATGMGGIGSEEFGPYRYLWGAQRRDKGVMVGLMDIEEYRENIFLQYAEEYARFLLGLPTHRMLPSVQRDLRVVLHSRVSGGPRGEYGNVELIYFPYRRVNVYSWGGRPIEGPDAGRYYQFAYQTSSPHPLYEFTATGNINRTLVRGLYSTYLHALQRYDSKYNWDVLEPYFDDFLSGDFTSVSLQEVKSSEHLRAAIAYAIYLTQHLPEVYFVGDVYHYMRRHLYYWGDIYLKKADIVSLYDNLLSLARDYKYALQHGEVNERSVEMTEGGTVLTEEQAAGIKREEMSADDDPGDDSVMYGTIVDPAFDSGRLTTIDGVLQHLIKRTIALKSNPETAGQYERMMAILRGYYLQIEAMRQWGFYATNKPSADIYNPYPTTMDRTLRDLIWERTKRIRKEPEVVERHTFTREIKSRLSDVEILRRYWTDYLWRMLRGQLYVGESSRRFPDNVFRRGSIYFPAVFTTTDIELPSLDIINRIRPEIRYRFIDTVTPIELRNRLIEEKPEAVKNIPNELVVTDISFVEGILLKSMSPLYHWNPTRNQEYFLRQILQAIRPLTNEEWGKLKRNELIELLTTKDWAAFYGALFDPNQGIVLSGYPVMDAIIRSVKQEQLDLVLRALEKDYVQELNGKEYEIRELYNEGRVNEIINGLRRSEYIIVDSAFKRDIYDVFMQQDADSIISLIDQGKISFENPIIREFEEAISEADLDKLYSLIADGKLIISQSFPFIAKIAKGPRLDIVINEEASKGLEYLEIPVGAENIAALSTLVDTSPWAPQLRAIWNYFDSLARSWVLPHQMASQLRNRLLKIDRLLEIFEKVAAITGMVPSYDEIVSTLKVRIDRRIYENLATTLWGWVRHISNQFSKSEEYRNTITYNWMEYVGEYWARDLYPLDFAKEVFRYPSTISISGGSEWGEEMWGERLKALIAMNKTAANILSDLITEISLLVPALSFVQGKAGNAVFFAEGRPILPFYSVERLYHQYIHRDLTLGVQDWIADITSSLSPKESPLWGKYKELYQKVHSAIWSSKSSKYSKTIKNVIDEVVKSVSNSIDKKTLKILENYLSDSKRGNFKSAISNIIRHTVSNAIYTILGRASEFQTLEHGLYLRQIIEEAELQKRKKRPKAETVDTIIRQTISQLEEKHLAGYIDKIVEALSGVDSAIVRALREIEAKVGAIMELRKSSSLADLAIRRLNVREKLAIAILDHLETIKEYPTVSADYSKVSKILEHAKLGIDPKEIWARNNEVKNAIVASRRQQLGKLLVYTLYSQSAEDATIHHGIYLLEAILNHELASGVLEGVEIPRYNYIISQMSQVKEYAEKVLPTPKASGDDVSAFTAEDIAKVDYIIGEARSVTTSTFNKLSKLSSRNAGKYLGDFYRMTREARRAINYIIDNFASIASIYQYKPSVREEIESVLQDFISGARKSLSIFPAKNKKLWDKEVVEHGFKTSTIESDLTKIEEALASLKESVKSGKRVSETLEDEKGEEAFRAEEEMDKTKEEAIPEKEEEGIAGEKEEAVEAPTEEQKEEVGAMEEATQQKEEEVVRQEDTAAEKGEEESVVEVKEEEAVPSKEEEGTEKEEIATEKEEAVAVKEEEEAVMKEEEPGVEAKEEAAVVEEEERGVTQEEAKVEEKELKETLYDIIRRLTVYEARGGRPTIPAEVVEYVWKHYGIKIRQLVDNLTKLENVLESWNVSGNDNYVEIDINQYTPDYKATPAMKSYLNDEGITFRGVRLNTLYHLFMYFRAYILRGNVHDDELLNRLGKTFSVSQMDRDMRVYFIRYTEKTGKQLSELGDVIASAWTILYAYQNSKWFQSFVKKVAASDKLPMPIAYNNRLFATVEKRGSGDMGIFSMNLWGKTLYWIAKNIDQFENSPAGRKLLVEQLASEFIKNEEIKREGNRIIRWSTRIAPRGALLLLVGEVIGETLWGDEGEGNIGELHSSLGGTVLAGLLGFGLPWGKNTPKSVIASTVIKRLARSGNQAAGIIDLQRRYNISGIIEDRVIEAGRKLGGELNVPTYDFVGAMNKQIGISLLGLLSADVVEEYTGIPSELTRIVSGGMLLNSLVWGRYRMRKALLTPLSLNVQRREIGRRGSIENVDYFGRIIKNTKKVGAISESVADFIDTHLAGNVAIRRIAKKLLGSVVGDIESMSNEEFGNILKLIAQSTPMMRIMDYQGILQLHHNPLAKVIMLRQAQQASNIAELRNITTSFSILFDKKFRSRNVIEHAMRQVEEEIGNIREYQRQWKKRDWDDAAWDYYGGIIVDYVDKNDLRYVPLRHAATILYDENREVWRRNLEEWYEKLLDANHINSVLSDSIYVDKIVSDYRIRQDLEFDSKKKEALALREKQFIQRYEDELKKDRFRYATYAVIRDLLDLSSSAYLSLSLMELAQPEQYWGLGNHQNLVIDFVGRLEEQRKELDIMKRNAENIDPNLIVEKELIVSDMERRLKDIQRTIVLFKDTRDRRYVPHYHNKDGTVAVVWKMEDDTIDSDGNIVRAPVQHVKFFKSQKEADRFVAWLSKTGGAGIKVLRGDEDYHSVLRTVGDHVRMGLIGEFINKALYGDTQDRQFSERLVREWEKSSNMRFMVGEERRYDIEDRLSSIIGLYNIIRNELDADKASSLIKELEDIGQAVISSKVRNILSYNTWDKRIEALRRYLDSIVDVGVSSYVDGIIGAGSIQTQRARGSSMEEGISRVLYSVAGNFAHILHRHNLRGYELYWEGHSDPYAWLSSMVDFTVNRTSAIMQRNFSRRVLRESLDFLRLTGINDNLATIIEKALRNIDPADYESSGRLEDLSRTGRALVTASQLAHNVLSAINNYILAVFTRLGQLGDDLINNRFGTPLVKSLSRDAIRRDENIVINYIVQNNLHRLGRPHADIYDEMVFKERPIREYDGWVGKMMKTLISKTGVLKVGNLLYNMVIQDLAETGANVATIRSAVRRYLATRPGDLEGATKYALQMIWRSQGLHAPHSMYRWEKKLLYSPFAAFGALTSTSLRLFSQTIGRIHDLRVSLGLYDKKKSQRFYELAGYAATILAIIPVTGLQGLQLWGDIYNGLINVVDTMMDLLEGEPDNVVRETAEQTYRRIFVTTLNEKLGIPYDVGNLLFKIAHKGVWGAFNHDVISTNSNMTQIVGSMFYTKVGSVNQAINEYVNGSGDPLKSILYLTRAFSAIGGRTVAGIMQLDKGNYILRNLETGVPYDHLSFISELLFGKPAWLVNPSITVREGGYSVETLGDRLVMLRRMSNLSGLTMSFPTNVTQEEILNKIARGEADRWIFEFMLSKNFAERFIWRVIDTYINQYAAFEQELMDEIKEKKDIYAELFRQAAGKIESPGYGYRTEDEFRKYARRIIKNSLLAASILHILHYDNDFWKKTWPYQKAGQYLLETFYGKVSMEELADILKPSYHTEWNYQHSPINVLKILVSDYSVHGSLSRKLADWSAKHLGIEIKESPNYLERYRKRIFNTRKRVYEKLGLEEPTRQRFAGHREIRVGDYYEIETEEGSIR